MSSRIEALLAALPLNKDVSFDRIHEAVFGHLDLDSESKVIQRRIGPYVAKANRGLVGEIILPGERKRTYRRVSL